MKTGCLAGENQFFPIFQILLALKPFSAWCKFIFTTNPLVCLVETVLWLVKTILFQFLKYHFCWKQFFHLVEKYFKRILYYGQWQRIFCLIGTILIHSYFLMSTIIAIRGRPIFKRILYLLVETVFFKFFRHWFKWKQSFDPLTSYFSTNPSFWLVETIFS